MIEILRLFKQAINSLKGLPKSCLQMRKKCKLVRIKFRNKLPNKFGSLFPKKLNKTIKWVKNVSECITGLKV